MTDPADAELRKAVRAFVRANHPDRGGDPHAFAAGLAALRRRAAPVASAEITFYRRETGARALVGWVRRRRERARRAPRVQ